MKKKGISTAKLKKQLMKDPEFRKEYEALGPEFELAEELIRARMKAGLTQLQVARKMGTAQSFVARLESGKKPTLSTLERYAAAVGKTVRLELV